MECAASSVFQEGYAAEMTSVFVFDNSYFGAILRNDLLLVQKYLAMGCTPMTVQGSSGRALHYAIRHNKIEVLKLFEPRMRDKNINVLNCLDGLTPLQTSMETQVDVEVSEMLCRWGADANCKSSVGLPTLYYFLNALFKTFKEEGDTNASKLTETVYYERLTQFADCVFSITNLYSRIMLSRDKVQIQRDPIAFESFLISKLHCLRNTSKNLYLRTAVRRQTPQHVFSLAQKD